MARLQKFAAVLRELSAKVDMARLQKSRSRPKKTKPKRRHSKKRPHVSTFRILQARKAASR
jgi:hypothetical protein